MQKLVLPSSVAGYDAGYSHLLTRSRQLCRRCTTFAFTLCSAETGQPSDKVHPRSPMMLEASDIANWLHNARRRLFAYRTRQRVAITTVTFVSALPVSKLSIRRLD
jgi:hypothetical protein